jgi:hypothetical protein
MADEIAGKSKSLKQQIKMFYNHVWSGRLFNMTRRLIIPETVKLSWFLGLDVMEESDLDELIPPFPIERTKDLYSVEYLENVIFPSIVEQFPSLFEQKKHNIIERIKQDVYLRLRPQILESCQEQSFVDRLQMSGEILHGRVNQWIHLGASASMLGSAILSSIPKAINDLPIFNSPPLCIHDFLH